MLPRENFEILISLKCNFLDFQGSTGLNSDDCRAIYDRSEGPDSTTKALFASHTISLDGSLPSNIFSSLSQLQFTIEYSNDFVPIFVFVLCRAKYLAK